MRTPKPLLQKAPWHWYEYATLFAFLVVLLVFFLGGMFVLKPRYDQILALRSQAQSARAREQAKTEVLKRIHRLIENARSLSSESRAKLAYMLPAAPDLPGLFVQVEQLTQASGMRLTSVGIEEKGVKSSRAPASVLALPFSISYEVGQANPYGVLKQSLQAFEQNLRLFDLETFAFEVKGEQTADSGDASLKQKREMEMKFTTYYFPQK